jgi:hypothetical protein
MVRSPHLIRLAVTGALAASLAGALSGPTSAALRPRVVACTGSAIDAWLNTSANGSAGHLTYRLEFTNMSTTTYAIIGYPAVAAVSLTGHQVGAGAAHGAGPAHLVTLVHGATASAMLQVTNTALYTPSLCHATLAAGFHVVVPGTTTGRFLPFPVSMCANVHQVTLSVQPAT